LQQAENNIERAMKCKGELRITISVTFYQYCWETLCADVLGARW